MPVVGLNMLIILPHGWVIVGFVAEQTAPFQFKIENTSVIAETNGTEWAALADGAGRGSARFLKYGTVHIGPQYVFSKEWSGNLP
jgi:hypothetical protein